jgi:hypothetical protein
MQHPQKTRHRLYQKSNAERIVLFPLFAFMFLLLRLSRLLGFESQWFRLSFLPLYRRAVRAIRSAFKGYEPTEKDVFICSFMKSGTNWGMQIAYQIACKGEGEYDHIHDVVPWPDAPAKGFAVPLNHPLTTKNATKRQIIKTHNIAQHVPYNTKARYVCIVRNPEDVFVSSYHFFRPAMLGFLMPSVTAWLDFTLSAEATETNWATFTAGYWTWRDRPNVLFITFEEMVADLKGSVRKIADLIGVTLTEAEFEKVCELSSYKYMKTINHKFAPGRMLPLASVEGEMIRSGKKGEGKAFLNDVQKRRIHQYSLDSLQRLGSDFPFEALYKKS